MAYNTPKWLSPLDTRPRNSKTLSYSSCCYSSRFRERAKVLNPRLLSQDIKWKFIVIELTPSYSKNKKKTSSMNTVMKNNFSDFLDFLPLPYFKSFGFFSEVSLRISKKIFHRFLPTFFHGLLGKTPWRFLQKSFMRFFHIVQGLFWVIFYWFGSKLIHFFRNNSRNSSRSKVAYGNSTSVFFRNSSKELLKKSLMS